MQVCSQQARTRLACPGYNHASLWSLCHVNRVLPLELHLQHAVHFDALQGADAGELARHGRR